MRYNGCEYTPYLRYYNLHNLTRYADSEDTDYLCKSLEVQHDNNLDKNFLQLYNFYEPTVQNFNFTLKYDDKPYHITNGLSSVVDKQILVRDGTGTQAELEYWDFTITAPKVGTGDITNELY